MRYIGILIFTIMPPKITEVEAISQTEAILKHLTPVEQQRIFDWLKARFSLIDPGTGAKNSSGSGTLSGNTGSGKNQTIKDFIILKKPLGFYERIACLAYYLEKFNDMDGFKTKDITKANNDAKQNKIPHSSLYVGDTTSKYGFLIASGQAKKSLSARGEEVVDALPDRTK